MRLRPHHSHTDDGRDIEAELRRQILTLWQTALIRLSRLKIQDEIETGLRFTTRRRSSTSSHRSTPRSVALWEPAGPAPTTGRADPAPGSWIGGDRDGNPTSPPTWCGWPPAAPRRPPSRTTSARTPALEEELSMSARLVHISDDLGTLADALDEAARADEPYRRALRVVHARLTGTAADPDRQPEHELELGLPRYAHRANCSRIWTSSMPRCAPTAAPCWPRPAGPAAGSGASVRFSSVRSGHATELRHARRRGRRTARLGGVHRTMRRCRRTSASRSWSRAVHPPATDHRDARPVELARKELGIVKAAAGRRTLRAAGGAELHHLDVPVGVGHAPRPRCCSRRPDCSMPPARRPTVRSGSCRCSRPSTICSTARRSWSRRWACRCTGASSARAATARKSCSAIPARTRTAAIWPPTGLYRAELDLVEMAHVRREFGCGSSTVAAGRSGVAAVRATTPSWPSRRARSTARCGHRAGRGHRGEVRRTGDGAPQSGDARRRDVESTLLDVEGLGSLDDDAYAVLDDLAARAQRLFQLVHETPGFVEYFEASTPVERDRCAQHRQPPDIPEARRRRSRTCGPSPGVLAWSQSRIMLPGWYGTGTAIEQWIADFNGRRRGPAGRAAGSLPALAFFRTVLSNMAQVLAKSDMGLAARYSELVEDPGWAGCSADPRRTRADDRHAQVGHRPRRPAGRQPGAGAVGVQPLPYLEPLNHLQVELLRQHRAGATDERTQRGILLTMSGLATALRNSG